MTNDALTCVEITPYLEVKRFPSAANRLSVVSILSSTEPQDVTIEYRIVTPSGVVHARDTPEETSFDPLPVQHLVGIMPVANLLPEGSFTESGTYRILLLLNGNEFAETRLLIMIPDEDRSESEDTEEV
jgi:hypothetical protein